MNDFGQSLPSHFHNLRHNNSNNNNNNNNNIYFFKFNNKITLFIDSKK